MLWATDIEKFPFSHELTEKNTPHTSGSCASKEIQIDEISHDREPVH